MVLPLGMRWSTPGCDLALMTIGAVPALAKLFKLSWDAFDLA